MTRIQLRRLTHKRGICVFVVVLVATTLAVAQVQAPITWGEARQFGVGHGYHGQRVALMGDTIVLVADSLRPNFGKAAISCYSHDNGQTFSPWQVIDTQYWYNSRTTVRGSGELIVAICTVSYDQGSIVWPALWIRRSQDGGMNWTICQPLLDGFLHTNGLVAGSQVIRLQQDRNLEIAVNQIVLSNDGGNTWQNPVQYSDGFVQTWPITVTQSHTIIIGYDWTIGAPVVSSFAGDRNGENWTPFQNLNPIRSLGGLLSIAGDTNSETAMVITVLDIESGSQGGDLYLIRTLDGGISWEPPRALTSGGPILLEYALCEVFCRGKLWGIAWEDFWNPDSTQWSVYFSFSANHGQDWYPPSYMGLDVPLMVYSGGQFLGDELRIYWSDPASEGYDYGTLTGVLTPDTISPEITLNLTASDTIHIGDTLRFQATVEENDTLSEVRVLMADSNGVLPTILLARAEASSYQGSFVVPHAGVFQYRGEAEDFWENEGVYPNTGWIEFATEGYYSEIKEKDPALPVPFQVLVYPNPSNGWPILTLAPEWIQNRLAMITVYNVLGQKFFEETVTKETVRLGGEREEGTGIYFARVRNGQRTAVVKFLVVK